MYVWSVDPKLILLRNQSVLTLTKVTFWPIGTSNCDISLQSFIFTCRSLLLTVTSFRIEFGPFLTGDTLLLLLHKLTPLCHFRTQWFPPLRLSLIVGIHSQCVHHTGMSSQDSTHWSVQWRDLFSRIFMYMMSHWQTCQHPYFLSLSAQTGNTVWNHGWYQRMNEM